MFRKAHDVPLLGRSILLDLEMSSYVIPRDKNQHHRIKTDEHCLPRSKRMYSSFPLFTKHTIFPYIQHTHTYRGSESAFSSMSEDITVGDDVSSMMAPSEIFLEQSEWLGPSSEAEEE